MQYACLPVEHTGAAPALLGQQGEWDLRVSGGGAPGQPVYADSGWFGFVTLADFMDVSVLPLLGLLSRFPQGAG